MGTTKFDYTALGAAVKNKRGKYSQAWVSQRLVIDCNARVSVNTISRLEMGLTCSIETALAIAKWLGRDLNEFVVQE